MLFPEEDTYSFYGRSTPNPEWNQGVIQIASKCFHSTKKLLWSGFRWPVAVRPC